MSKYQYGYAYACSGDAEKMKKMRRREAQFREAPVEKALREKTKARNREVVVEKLAAIYQRTPTESEIVRVMKMRSSYGFERIITELSARVMSGLQLGEEYLAQMGDLLYSLGRQGRLHVLTALQRKIEYSTSPGEKIFYLLAALVPTENYGTESDSDSESSEGDEYPAQMEDHHLPFSSENHLTSLQSGEILAGGMPRRKGRPKGRERGKKNSKQPVRSPNRSIFDFRTRIIPPETTVELTYENTFYLTSAGFSACAKSHHTNDGWDVDPALGGLATIGLVTWADFYINFRNIGYKIMYEVTNEQTFPVSGYNYHGTTDASSTPSNLHRLATNANCVSFILSGKGSPGCKHTWSFSRSISSIVGSDAPKVADNFMGLLDGSLRVADHTYSTLGFDTHSGNLFTTGVFVRILLSQRILLYSRKEVVS